MVGNWLVVVLYEVLKYWETKEGWKNASAWKRREREREGNRWNRSKVVSQKYDEGEKG